MKIIHYHLNRAMAEYRRILKEQGIDTCDIWLARWVILKNMERWSFKECRIIENLLARYQGTTIEDILILKQKIRDIFLTPKNQQEAYQTWITQKYQEAAIQRTLSALGDRWKRSDTASNLIRAGLII